MVVQNYIRRRKTLLALIVTSLIVTTFVFSTAASALSINLSAPSSNTLGDIITFSAKVQIDDADLLPLQSIDLQVFIRRLLQPTRYYLRGFRSLRH